MVLQVNSQRATVWNECVIRAFFTHRRRFYCSGHPPFSDNHLSEYDLCYTPNHHSQVCCDCDNGNGSVMEVAGTFSLVTSSGINVVAQQLSESPSWLQHTASTFPQLKCRECALCPVRSMHPPECTCSLNTAPGTCHLQQIVNEAPLFKLSTCRSINMKGIARLFLKIPWCYYYNQTGLSSKQLREIAFFCHHKT